MTAAPRRIVPFRVRAYVVVVASTAMLLTPASTLFGGGVRGPAAWLGCAVLAGLIAFSHRRPVQIGLKRTVNAGTAPEVAAVLTLSGPFTVLAVLAGTIAGEASRSGPAIQRAFNCSVAVLRAVCGMTVYAAILRLGPDSFLEPAAMLAAGVVMQATATLLVLGITSVQLRENPLRRAWMPQRETLIIELTLSLTGILTALAAREHVWALLVLAAPLAIAQRALRDGVALRAQTRIALEELADIVDMRDHYTYEHSRRVAELARATAKKLALDADMVELVTMAGRVHDVGKIGIKSSVLMKPGKLTDAEWQEMRSHPVVGARLIGGFPQFAHGRGFVLHHHERYDGKGYPNALSGERIPLGARILAVADAWDAMTSHRAYRKALDLAVVRAEMERGRGTQFDPAVLTAFLAVLDERPDLATPAVHVQQDVDEAPYPPAVQPATGTAAA